MRRRGTRRRPAEEQKVQNGGGSLASREKVNSAEAARHAQLLGGAKRRDRDHGNDMHLDDEHRAAEALTLGKFSCFGRAAFVALDDLNAAALRPHRQNSKNRREMLHR